MNFVVSVIGIGVVNVIANVVVDIIARGIESDTESVIISVSYKDSICSI